MLRPFMTLIGLELTPFNHREKLLSGLGGLAGILAIALITRTFAPPGAVMPIVASMGASCVLLFAAPHSPLSQPWPIFIGHLLSALVGVLATRLTATPLLAAPLSVGLAITAMYYARAIHPPGGATALTAVLAASSLRSLGFAYAVFPVSLNVLVLLAVAFLFNLPFPWRRYPSSLSPGPFTKSRLTREDFTYALTHTPTLADISEDDLLTLHTLATQHAASRTRARPLSAKTAPSPASAPKPQSATLT